MWVKSSTYCRADELSIQAIFTINVHYTTKNIQYTFQPGFNGLLSNNDLGLLWSEMMMMEIGANLRV